MSLHINRFIDLVKAHEARGQHTLNMPLRDAKDLHSDITKLLMSVTSLQHQLLEQKSQPIEVNIAGNKF